MMRCAYLFVNSRLFFLLVLGWLSHCNALAQGQYNNWHFGIGSAMTFTDTGIRVVSGSKVHAMEGAASISDSAGKLLFYVGAEIRDRNNNRMKGDSMSYYDGTTQQSFLIIPKPGFPNIYYYLLNATDPAYVKPRSIYIQVIDMNRNGGLGEVVSQKDVLFANSTEQMTASRHRNGRDIWIVTHSFSSNEFYSFLVTKNGISRTPIVSPAGVNPGGAGYAYAGTVKISQSGCWLAATIRQTIQDEGVLQLMRFNNVTGRVINGAHIVTPHPYGIEFSPDNRFLYLGSSTVAPITQFDLSAGSESAILAAGTYCSDTFLSTFDFQLGPDNRIYFSGIEKTWKGNVPRHLGVIRNPNAAGNACDAAMDFSCTFPEVSAGLPNNYNMFVKDLDCKNCDGISEVRMHRTVCYGDSVYFTGRFYKTPGTYRGDTVLNSLFCDSTTLLELKVRGRPQSTSRHTICRPDSFVFFDSIIYASGSYVHHLQSSQGCDSLVILDLLVNPRPQSPQLHIPDTLMCDDVSAGFNLAPYKFREMFLDGQRIPNYFSTGTAGRHIVQYRDTNSCLSADTFFIDHFLCDTLHLRLPNVFTPGTDGFNDCFDIEIEGETHYGLFVYDRWGVLVYRQEEDAEGTSAANWNGRVFNTGNECPAGTYYYVFEFASRKKVLKRLNGVVQVLR